MLVLILLVHDAHGWLIFIFLNQTHMKNFSKQACSILSLSLIFTLYSGTALKANSASMAIDSIPEVKFDSLSNAYISVKVMPTFPDGEKALMDIITGNLKYPEQAQKLGIQGFVIVQFLIDKTGKIINPMVIRGIGGGCDEEAIRIVKLLPDWTPGYHDGEPVPVKFSLPIRFKLSSI